MTTFPTVRSARPQYPPPIPSGFIDPGGRTPVEHAFRTQQAVAKAYTDWRAAHSPDIAPEVLRDNAGVYGLSDAALQLPTVLDAVKDDAQAATRKAADLVKNNRVGSDTASQIAAQRFWARAQQTLDSIKDVPKVAAAAQDLVANADDEQVPVLSEELPSYLANRGVPAGWLTGALADKIPGLADATADARIKAKQHAILAQNHAALSRAMAKDVAAPNLVDPAIATAQPYSDGNDE
jgi:hypothetical protein